MTDVPIEPLTLAIPGVVKVSGMSRTAIYNALKTGDLMGKKSGRRTLISVAELHRFLDALPTYKPAV